MISVVCFKWQPAPGYRSSFGPETVNVLRRMVARNFSRPHRFVCVTDDATGLDPEVTVVPLWPDHAELPNPDGAKHPSCYRRLKLFDPAIADVLGPRFVALDLDCVITGDVTPLWDRPEECVLWNGTHPRNAYNASMLLLTAGARRRIWTGFDPLRSPRIAHAAGHFGSDQAWICYRLGPGEPRWTTADGVYSFRCDMRRYPHQLPKGARVVFFHGKFDPWSPPVSAIEWVQRCYR